jgi:DNA gyrase/topoisomerase IV subunit A
MKAGDVRTSGRMTQGVKLMDLDKEDKIVGAAKVPESIGL